MLMRDHEAFYPPKHNCRIWRYLDFTKFLHLLESRKLSLLRADQFEDPYEGFWSPEGVRQLRDEARNGGMPTEQAEQLIRWSATIRKSMYISCWHVNEHESAAMWKLYLQSTEGIAIQSDYDTLASLLDKSTLNAGISMVQYIDYDKVAIGWGNCFYPFVHKRLSFAHENELRVVVWQMDSTNAPQIEAGSESVAIDVDPGQLIQSAYVSPVAPRWFGELVDQVLRRYGLAVPLVRSSLYDRPAF